MELINHIANTILNVINMDWKVMLHACAAAYIYINR